MTRIWKALSGLMLATALVACGGGGGDPGTNPSTTPGTNTGGGTTGGTTGGTNTGGGTTDPTAAATAKVADFALFSDKSSIANTGAETAKITVQAVDANRSVVAGATVAATADQNSIFTPGSTTTDASGTFSGTLAIGGDKTDRDITVAVTINGVTKRTTVHVGGSKLTVSANPTAPQPGQSVTLTANLKDASGQAIQGQTVTFNSAAAGITNRTASTNSTGDASITVTAPSSAGVYTISATGSGTLAPDLQLQVLAAGGSVPTASLPAGTTPSFSATPNVLSVNTPGSTANKSVLRFLFLDNANNPVPNVRVRFDDLTTGLPAQGASIASGTTTLFTDASGIATTQYIAGQNSSSTNGVSIRACYSATDFASTTDCPKSVVVSLTVAGQALAVSIGDDNLLSSANGTYTKRFAVTVADSAGRAVANAPVDISVDLTHYAKGFFGAEFEPGGPVDDALAVVSTLGPTKASPDMSTDPVAPTATSAGLNSWCPNEDVNRNGIVDATTVFAAEGADSTRGENYNGSTDSNGNPTLEPRKSDLLINYDNPAVTTTDANGILIIKVTYSQRFATWLAYKIRVTTNVAGSQGLAERLFVTDALQGDVANGSFRTPPYGTKSCLSAN
jgi:hypothetical protein